MKDNAIDLLAYSTEAGIPLMIIFTGRLPEEQAALYAQGRTKPGQIVTWTLDSKHVMKSTPCPNSGETFKAHAIDICPWEEFRLNGPDKLAWSADSQIWAKLGAIGERFNLKWGIWKNGERIDLGHFEAK